MYVLHGLTINPDLDYYCQEGCVMKNLFVPKREFQPLSLAPGALLLNLWNFQGFRSIFVIHGGPLGPYLIAQANEASLRRPLGRIISARLLQKGVLETKFKHKRNQSVNQSTHQSHLVNEAPVKTIDTEAQGQLHMLAVLLQDCHT